MAAISQRARQLPRQAIISSVDIGSNQFGDQDRCAVRRGIVQKGLWLTWATFWREPFEAATLRGMGPEYLAGLPDDDTGPMVTIGASPSGLKQRAPP
jgi:hypothetical protein